MVRQSLTRLFGGTARFRLQGRLPARRCILNDLIQAGLEGIASMPLGACENRRPGVAVITTVSPTNNGFAVR